MARALKFQRLKRLLVAAATPGDKNSARTRKRNLALLANFGSKIRCRFCAKTLKNTSEYVEHVRCYHLNLPPIAMNKSNCDTSGTIQSEQIAKMNENQANISSSNEHCKNLVENLTDLTENIAQNFLQKSLASVQIEDSDLGFLLRDLYPDNFVKTMNPRKKYVCAVCKSVCDLFGLFSHMKTVHKGLLCQYCLKLFKKVADLENHLKKTHHVYQRYYHNKKLFEEYSGTSYTFSCTKCSSFVAFKNLEAHKCAVDQDKLFECPFCERAFGRQVQLDLHLSNGWCKEMTWMLKMEYQTDSYQSSMLLRSQRLAVLTGRKNNEPLDAATLTEFETESRIQEPDLCRPSTAISLTNLNKNNVLGANTVISSVPNKNSINFNPWDRNFLQKFSNSSHDCLKTTNDKSRKLENIIINDIPNTGSIFCGSKTRGFNSFVSKEETELGERYNIAQKYQNAAASQSSEKCVALDELTTRMQIFKAKNNFFIHDSRDLLIRQSSISAAKAAKAVAASTPNFAVKVRQKSTDFENDILNSSNVNGLKHSNLNIIQNTEMVSTENKENSNLNITDPSSTLEPHINMNKERLGVSMKIDLSHKRESKAERMLRVGAEIELGFINLRTTLDYFAEHSSQEPNIGTSTESNDGNKSMGQIACLMCQQARIITVDAIFIYTHLSTHDPEETVKVLKENPQDAILRIKKYFRDSRLKEMTFQYECLQDERLSQGDESEGQDHDQQNKYKRFLNDSGTYSCCGCSNASSNTYNKLLEHLDTNHNSKVLTCQLCQNIFLNYGSFISHVCYGPPTNAPDQHARAKFSCKVCDRQDLQTFLEFQYHIRKKHNVCEICFWEGSSQKDLYQHCNQHSNELMCMKCFRAYDDQMQFRKHLYFNHQTEHKICAQCHMKTWPHVYHFCLSSSVHHNTCEVCDKHFDNFQKYRVHFRTHTGATPYICTSQGCGKSYISKQLLYKHNIRRHPELKNDSEKYLLEKREKREMAKFGATQVESVKVIEAIVNSILGEAVTEQVHSEKNNPDVSTSQLPLHEITAAEILANLSEATLNESFTSKLPTGENQQEKVTPEEYDPVAAAVSSIMDIDSMFSVKKSPVKNHVNASPIREPHLISNSGDQRLVRLGNTPATSSPGLIKLTSKAGDSSDLKLRKQANQILPPTLISFQRSTSNIDDGSVSKNIDNLSRIVTVDNESTDNIQIRSSNLTTSMPSTSPVVTELNVLEHADESLKETTDTSIKSAVGLIDKISPTTADQQGDHPKTLSETATASNVVSVFGSIWNQDLQSISKEEQLSTEIENSISETMDISETTTTTLKLDEESTAKTIDTLDSKTINKKLVTGQGWDVDLSESSDDSDIEGIGPKKVINDFFLSFLFSILLILVESYNVSTCLIVLIFFRQEQ